MKRMQGRIHVTWMQNKYMHATKPISCIARLKKIAFHTPPLMHAVIRTLKLRNWSFSYLSRDCGYMHTVRIVHKNGTYPSPRLSQLLSTGFTAFYRPTAEAALHRLSSDASVLPNRRTDAGNLPRIRWCQSLLTHHWPCLSVLDETKSDTSGFHEGTSSGTARTHFNPPNYALGDARCPIQVLQAQVKLLEIPAIPFPRYSSMAHCANSVFPERTLANPFLCSWKEIGFLRSLNTAPPEYALELYGSAFQSTWNVSPRHLCTSRHWRDAEGLRVLNHDCLSHHNFVRQNRNALFWRTDISGNNLVSFFSQAKENEWVTLKTR